MRDTGTIFHVYNILVLVLEFFEVLGVPNPVLRWVLREGVVS